MRPPRKFIRYLGMFFKISQRSDSYGYLPADPNTYRHIYSRRCHIAADSIFGNYSFREPPQYSQQPFAVGSVVAPHQGQLTACLGAAAAAAASLPA